MLNEKQLHTLRTCYAANPRPDALMKEQLVEMTGLSPRVIRVWFQNKRCKDKKRSIMMKQLQQQQPNDKTVSSPETKQGRGGRRPWKASGHPYELVDWYSVESQQEPKQGGPLTSPKPRSMACTVYKKPESWLLRNCRSLNGDPIHCWFQKGSWPLPSSAPGT